LHAAPAREHLQAFGLPRGFAGADARRQVIPLQRIERKPRFAQQRFRGLEAAAAMNQQLGGARALVPLVRRLANAFAQVQVVPVRVEPAP